MKKLLIGLISVILLAAVSCATSPTVVTGPGTPQVSPEPAPAPAPPPAPEEKIELDIESWEIGENWRYSRQAVWGDVMAGWEIEQQRGQIVRQSIATYDLRSREKQSVLEVLEVPAAYSVSPVSVYKNRIVWASTDAGNSDIFLFDLNTGEAQQLTTEEHDQLSPGIYGDTVVWLDKRHEETNQYYHSFDVYAYDLNTGEERRLTSATTAEGYGLLSISGNLVVWTDIRHTDPEVTSHSVSEPEYNNEIYVYDLTTSQEKRITTYPGNDRHPDISGSNIVWLRQEDYIRADVFVYNMETDQEIQVSHSGYADFRPSIYGDRIVWADARVSQGNTSGDTVINGRQGQTDIYLYDLKAQQEIPLTSTGPGDVLYHPVIHGDSVVYVQISMLSSIVYAMNLTYK